MSTRLMPTLLLDCCPATHPPVSPRQTTPSKPQPATPSRCSSPRLTQRPPCQLNQPLPLNPPKTSDSVQPTRPALRISKAQLAHPPSLRAPKRPRVKKLPLETTMTTMPWTFHSKLSWTFREPSKSPPKCQVSPDDPQPILSKSGIKTLRPCNEVIKLSKLRRKGYKPLRS